MAAVLSSLLSAPDESGIGDRCSNGFSKPVTMMSLLWLELTVAVSSSAASASSSATSRRCGAALLVDGPGEWPKMSRSRKGLGLQLEAPTNTGLSQPDADGPAVSLTNISLYNTVTFESVAALAPKLVQLPDVVAAAAEAAVEPWPGCGVC